MATFKFVLLILDLINSLFLLLGFGVLCLSSHFYGEWMNALDRPPPPPPTPEVLSEAREDFLPIPWFICAMAVTGGFVLLCGATGLLAAGRAGRCSHFVLGLYSTQLVLLLLLQLSVVVALSADPGLHRRLPPDPTGSQAYLWSLVASQLAVAKGAAFSLGGLQLLALLLSVGLAEVGRLGSPETEEGYYQRHYGAPGGASVRWRAGGGAGSEQPSPWAAPLLDARLIGQPALCDEESRAVPGGNQMDTEWDRRMRERFGLARPPPPCLPLCVGGQMGRRRGCQRGRTRGVRLAAHPLDNIVFKPSPRLPAAQDTSMFSYRPLTSASRGGGGRASAAAADAELSTRRRNNQTCNVM